MQVLDAAGRWTEIRTASAPSFLVDGYSGLGGQIELVPGPDGTRIFRDFDALYRANPWLFAVVRTHARGQCQLPLKLYRRLDEDSIEPVRPDRSTRAGELAACLRRPGRLLTGDGGRVSAPTLWFGTKVDKLVQGNGVWWIERTRSGSFRGFRRIPWRYVMSERIAGELRYWDSRDPQAKRLADDVVHFGAHLDSVNVVNPSPIEALRTTIALHDAVERHLVAFFKNSARPSGHLKVGKMTNARGEKDPAIEAIRDELTKLYTAPENAGKVLITSGEFTALTVNPDNTKVIELAKQSREEICATYNVPPPLVGILERAIMSNVRELRSHYVRDVVGPEAVLDEHDIDAQVLAPDPELGDDDEYLVEFLTAAMLRPDLEARAKTWKDQRYLLTLNEMRQIEGKPRINHPDADVPWMPLNEAPLGSDDAPKEEPPKPGGPDDEEPPDDE